MMKRATIVIAFLALVGAGTWAIYEPHDHSAHDHSKHVPTVAERQSFFKPGQVNPDHQYVAQPVVYSTNQIGDGSDANGGSAPAYNGRELPDVPSNYSVTAWMQDAVAGPDCVANAGSGGCPIKGAEAKFRTHCEYSHSMLVDPILYPNQVGQPHMHSFFGNTLTDHRSTYHSLRTTGGSTCGGGKINRTAYWYPSVLKDNALGDGKTMIVKVDFITVYYTDAASRVPKLTRIPRGLQYIMGFKPADPTDAAVKAEIAGSYTYYTSGWNGWKCASGNGAYIGGVVANGAYSGAVVAGSALQPYLRNADGTATLDCPSGSQLIASVSGPSCWDGVNIAAPDGRGHMRYVVNKTDGQKYCPDNWYWLPTIELSFFFSNNGPSDYKEWYLSSDRAGGATFKNGESFHTDWFGAWDYNVMKTWMKDCNGIADIDGSSGTDNWHECNNSEFGDGTQGVVNIAAPDRTRVPQLDLLPLSEPDRYDTLPENR